MALNIMPTHVRCNKNKKRLDTPGIENSVYIKKKHHSQYFGKTECGWELFSKMSAIKKNTKPLKYTVHFKHQRKIVKINICDLFHALQNLHYKKA